MAIDFSKHRRVAEKVEALLREYPECKSSDDKLLAYFWGFEMIAKTGNKETPNNLSARYLLDLISKGALTSPETIRRTRQQLQQRVLELRGSNYLVRQKIGEKVAKEINNM